MIWLRRGLLLLMSVLGLAVAHGQTPDYVHFEARHTHSIALTPDGSKLLVINTPDSRLSVFDVSNPANSEPVLIAEIPVGLEPVSVRARTNDEAWVVSELGDSVAVVSLSERMVLDTLPAPDEPADVVFAQGKAFVSCARNQLIRVFDAVSRVELGTIPLEGNYPRALATDPAGTKVFAAFLLSGNQTTIIPYSKTTTAERLQPTNGTLPPAPQTALIVPASDSRVPYTVLDRDVAEIDAASSTVTRYISGAGTNLFDLAVHPVTGDIWVANTHARNLTRFEPDLRGRLADHRITKLAATDGAATVYDVNPSFNYVAPMPYAFGLANSIAHPNGLAFTPDGAHVWVAGFNSDRLAKVATSNGAIAARVDVRPTGVGTRGMRGPRAMVLKAATERLYVLNKLSNTVTVVSTATNAVLNEVPAGSHDPTPTTIKEGRGFLFDARLSGRGVISCATCHLDADVDGLAWDLGDRAGTMIVVQGKNLSAHDETLRNRNMHPMKGPMVTQTLRGMQNGAPFHWRGDRPTLQSFNPTFDKLMGGAQLSTPDIDAMTTYLLSLKHHPNPFLQKDGSLPSIFQGGDLARGRDLFENHLNHCISCHSLPQNVTPNPMLPPLPAPDNNIDLPAEVGSSQPVKNPPLATVYQRLHYKPAPGQTSLSGFGMLHDGSGSGLPTVHPYVLDELTTVQDFLDVSAFVLCFHTGTAPAVGMSRTVNLANVASGGVESDLLLLESQSGTTAADLVVKGSIGGRSVSFVYDSATQRYLPNTANGDGLTRTALLAQIGGGDALTFLGAPKGYGARLGRDRDGDGILDQEETLPGLEILQPGGANVRLRWMHPAPGWLLQKAPSPSGPWDAVTKSLFRSGGWQWNDEGTAGTPVGFFRLRRTW